MMVVLLVDGRTHGVLVLLDKEHLLLSLTLAGLGCLCSIRMLLLVRDHSNLALLLDQHG